MCGMVVGNNDAVVVWLPCTSAVFSLNVCSVSLVISKIVECKLCLSQLIFTSHGTVWLSEGVSVWTAGVCLRAPCVSVCLCHQGVLTYCNQSPSLTIAVVNCGCRCVSLTQRTISLSLMWNLSGLYQSVVVNLKGFTCFVIVFQHITSFLQDVLQICCQSPVPGVVLAVCGCFVSSLPPPPPPPSPLLIFVLSSTVTVTIVYYCIIISCKKNHVNITDIVHIKEINTTQ